VTEAQFDRACDAAARRYWIAPDHGAYGRYQAEIAALTDRRMAALAGRAGR